MSTDANYPGTSEHPYSRYRCTKSSTHDVNNARAMISRVEARGFLVGVDPRTGKLTSRDCLDATYDVLKAYRTKRLTPAPKLSIPNVWVEELWGLVGQDADAPVRRRCPVRRVPDGAPCRHF
ncbi:hypothetical protein OHV08_35620 [Streptomyces canus]|uniref:hypothetical protein n=1 Tax=Streptomyces canus TaxID=58343 RepID=UPI0032481082